MLPTPPTPFVNRQEELAEIKRLLAEPMCRLLTLVGPAGIGKTRLALEALSHQDAGDVWYVPLQPLSSPDFIIPAIAEAVQFQFYPGGEPKGQLFAYLHNRTAMLLLDNFEHLMGGVEVVAELLHAAPQVRLLVTSRERLRLMEEWVLDVHGLSYPSDENTVLTDHYSAINLFLQHAIRNQVGFHLTEWQAVNRICRLVGGMPLGIELAAAWVRTLTCSEIASEIARSLDILETTTRNVAPRYRTMRAALEPSWRLLTAAEQEVFKRLSVFRGGFTREAAEFVAGATLHTLSGLIDKSLLKVNAVGRYDLHELLRQYADERLTTEERAATEERHSDYYAAFLQQRKNDLKGSKDRDATLQVVQEIDNIRTAWQWTLEQRRYTYIEQSWEGLFLAYSMLNWLHEGLQIFTQAAEFLKSDTDTSDGKITFVRIQLAKGWFAYRDSHYAKAKELYLQSLEVLGELKRDVSFEIQLAYCLLGFAAHALGEYEEGKQYCYKAIEICQRINEPYYECSSLLSLGRTSHAAGEHHKAREYLLVATSMARRIGTRWGLGYILSTLGSVAAALDEFEDAQSHLEESRAISSEFGDLWGVSTSLMGLGTTACALGNENVGWCQFQEALQIGVQISSITAILDALVELGNLLGKAGEVEWAVELLTLAVQHPGSLQNSRDRAERYLVSLEAKLPHDTAQAARERGKAADLDAMVNRLLASSDSILERLSVENTANEDGRQGQLAEPLSQRELDVLRLVAEGLSDQKIADVLVISLSTVKVHTRNIRGKLDAENRTRAVARARSLGLL